MADQDRLDPADLSTALAQAPYSFAFFEAIRLAERAIGRPDVLGYLGPAEVEPARLRTHLSLAFPASDLAAARWHQGADGTKQRLELTVTFFGLFGPASPLPAFYTERLIFNDETSAARDFLNLFDHRLLSLLYRAWRKYRLFLERRPTLEDAGSRALCALAGLPQQATEGSDAPRPERLLGMVAHLALWCRSAASIAAILQWYFPGVAFRVEEFVPREFTIDERERWRLGFGSLGNDLVLGDRIGDSAGRVRLWCGPLDRDVFAQFLPEGGNFPTLAALVRLLLRNPLEVVLVLTLKPQAMAAAQLGTDGFHLGHDTWLGVPDPGQTPWPSFLLPGA